MNSQERADKLYDKWGGWIPYSAGGVFKAELAAAIEQAVSEALEDISTDHFRCKACGKCACFHNPEALILKDTNISIAEYQQHIRALRAKAGERSGG